MAENKRLVVTREGLQKMKEELEYKETTEKMRIAEQLKVAISYGDLSENAEYDAAKNDQAALEQRISELKAMIENAVVVDESKINTDAVNFGTRVTIVDLDDEDEEQELAGEFGVFSIPTLIVMRGGEVVKQATGARPKAQILAMLDA